MDDILSTLVKVILNSGDIGSNQKSIITSKLNLKPLSSFIQGSLPEAVSELKEVSTLLTEISKTSDSLSKSDLAAMINDSFDIASKYGKTAADYLTSVQKALYSGYQNAEEIAELSLAAQNAGNMTADLADRLITATDEAYKMNGSVTELTKALDGINYISDHNAVNMTELSEGMAIVSSTAASLGVDLDEAAAALGTILAGTQQSGSEAAGAFEAILLNIKQISDMEGDIRAPMEILKDLSVEYNSLGDTDLRKAGLLSSVGGDANTAQLDALLRQWDTYEAMLQQYGAGIGSMAADAEKAASSLEGSLNRLHNTWVDTIENTANSNAIITLINGFNGLLSVVNHVTDAIGPLASIGLGTGLFAGLKNVGRDKMLSLKSCYLF